MMTQIWHGERVLTTRVVDYGALVRLAANDLVGLDWIDGRAQFDDLPAYSVGFRAVFQNEAYRVSSLTVEASGAEAVSVTGEVLRRIPVQAALVQLLKPVLVHVQAYSHMLDKGIERPPMMNLFGQSSGNLDALHKRWVDRELDRTAPKFLAEVVRTYRIARVLGEAPAKSVQEAFNMSRATASRYIARARAEGLLGVNETGHAGGARSRVES